MNQTNSESIMWEKLRNRKLWIKFQRQFPIYLFTENSWQDRYIIIDFYCSEKNLVIEIDGNIHNKSDIKNLDKTKEKYLLNQEYKILRFKNQEITDNIDIVIQKIVAIPPLLKREGVRGWVENKKNFIMRNESFQCENCWKEISKHPSWSARNHCNHCLYSKHLDLDSPWDRLATCHGLMKPVWIDNKKNKGWMIVHQCQKCDKKILNKLAEDDDMELFSGIRNII